MMKWLAFAFFALLAPVAAMAQTAPSIETQPVNVSVNVGSTATFSVVGAGSTPLSYQWCANGTPISGATSASYTTPATSAANDRTQYQVAISNASGSVTSNVVTLSVVVAPSITAQPTTQYVPPGQQATFTFAYSGNYASIIWHKNGNAIAGATGTSYTTTSADAPEDYFKAIVSNQAGQAITNIVQFLNFSAPSITTQPVSQSAVAGQPITFSVVAASSTALSYQWQQNGVNIVGATSATYTQGAACFTNNGATYRVVVSNSGGSVTSNSATLTLTCQ